MPELFLELLSEEIPARMQTRAADDLRRLVTDGLVDAGLTYEGARAFVTPRRLALTVQGVTVRSADLKEERKGPRVGAPEKALAGFLRGAGLASIDDAEVRSDPKKGDFYVAVVEKPGRSAEDIVAELIPSVVRRFPWPTSMRWGAASAPSREGLGSLKWVRPLRSIACTFGPESEDPEVVPFEIGGVASGNTTVGHRFHAPDAFEVRRLDDYAAKLEAAHVVLDAERRREIIRTEANNLAFASGLELVEDEALLEEVAGLVEWPVPLIGTFDEAFLDLSDEMIRLTIRTNQKCFVLRNGDKLSNRFVLVANIDARDGGKEVVAGNERVVAARLSDAKFFWENDLRVPLEERLEALKSVTFHEKLGTQFERVERIARLARELAPAVGADPDEAEEAARLAKADLTSESVYEFPELQGVMGRHIHLAQSGIGQGADAASLAHEEEAVEELAHAPVPLSRGAQAVVTETPATHARATRVADAIRDHYKPQGPSDDEPSEPVSVAVALADKLDTLVRFWAIGEKPTGSKDPYALRRAALGTIRLALANYLRLPLERILLLARNPHGSAFSVPADADAVGAAKDRIEAYLRDLLAFFHDRLKVHLRDQGARHDLIDAVLASGDEGTPNDDLLMIVRRVEALGRLLDTEDGANLLAGHRRAANILAAEEKKGTRVADAVDPSLFHEDEERALFAALEAIEGEVAKSVEQEDFDAAMRALATLRGPVDAFFEAVLVNAEDDAVRANRLALLARLREAMRTVADFSKIAG